MKWDKKEIPGGLVKNLAEKFGCDLLMASVLMRRGITKADDICFFLEDDLRYLHNPFDLPGMEDAVERILAAQEEGEKVLVFGDRDVDGISGTALLTQYLETLGVDVSWRVPSGDDPYGLSAKAVDEFAADSGTLIITVDCGISNTGEVKKANELGIDVIVTDHHNPQDELPGAYAIVNPKLANSNYPFRDLAGCAVVYKLVTALRFARSSELYGQPICLLNTRPVNDSWIIEIAKLRNMSRIANLSETIVPDPAGGRSVVSIGNTRLPAFLQGQQILVWDAPLQKRILNTIFGAAVEINMLDIAPEIGKEIPSAAGKSLLRIRELSRIAKYSENETGELDVFISLFNSFIRKKEKRADDGDSADLQLACLGTIADIMPLINENRIIVRQGLKSLRDNPRAGLADLLFKLDLGGKKIGANEISWQLSPAINSAGRMGNPRKAAALLLEKDTNIRDTLAGELIVMNEERKKLGAETWTLVEPLAGESLQSFSGNLSVACSEKIPRGVTGIMANRMMNRFKVPSMAVSAGDTVVTGSLRSVRGYDLRFLLEPCAHLFVDWGGHDYAAGFSMNKINWPVFLERLKTASVNIELEEIRDEEIIVDAELPLNFLTPDIFKLIDRFEPYGEGNEPLTFMARGVRIEAISLMGKSEAKHVKLTLDAGKYKWPAVYWQAADKVKKEFDLDDRVDLCFKIGRNWYNGNETPQIIVNDLRRSGQ
ncbi:MAG: single-stranded-DNA-specific exonuclease RecJ [Treponema sp.]|nr:single-stranded-DNA-specific exonuclease RecJ [Treponema sp.]